MKSNVVRKPAVALVSDGYTTDGKPLFGVVPVAEVPAEIHEATKGDKQNTPMTESDEFGNIETNKKVVV